jgi:hypothetical protein
MHRIWLGARLEVGASWERAHGAPRKITGWTAADPTRGAEVASISNSNVNMPEHAPKGGFDLCGLVRLRLARVVGGVRSRYGSGTLGRYLR